MAVKDTYENPKSQSEWVGKVFRCANCGSILESFSANCPACGIEFRELGTANSVREFAHKLETIESHREYKKLRTGEISKTDEQKISLIKSYSIPNTKEDILEFMILATTNIDMSVYSSLEANAGHKAMNEAWCVKIRQAYIKARNAYRSDNDFFKIQELYESCFNEIKKHKLKGLLKWVLFAGWIPMLIGIIVVICLICSSVNEVKEIKRLERIVNEVQDALDENEYKLALDNADMIDYQRQDKNKEREWDIQREYWINEVIERAKEEDVRLKYKMLPDVDNTNKERDAD